MIQGTLPPSLPLLLSCLLPPLSSSFSFTSHCYYAQVSLSSLGYSLTKKLQWFPNAIQSKALLAYLNLILLNPVGFPIFPMVIA